MPIRSIMRAAAGVAAWVLLGAGPARASDVVDVLPLTDRVLVVHFDDGHVVHHGRGQARSDETVVAAPLDTAAADRASAYAVGSADDARYAAAVRPAGVARKSKGTDFAFFVDRWVAGRAVNARPDHASEHWVYLTLAEPMARGRTYSVDTGDLAANGRRWPVAFDEATARSEAVHVNLLGYAPAAPQKFAYVYHWMGSGGPLDARAYAGRAFHLVDVNTKRRVFSGKVAFRKAADNPETFHKNDSPPHGNFLKADVCECDFSASDAPPGRYVVSVEGVGCSFPFAIGADVYREAFRTAARGLYHNRSGIALERPYTEFTRPAPHNPARTPGFKGKLLYTTARFQDWGSEGGDARALLAASKGPLDAWGWYQDAGDWDSYPTHMRVAQELMIAYELAPRNFTDGELNIPESGNGVPDILDEAAWLPRFGYRLRHELIDKKFGTGGVGLRVTGDAFGGDERVLADGRKVGQGSWEDVGRTWVVSGEDPWSTYRYAGAAAQLAHCLALAGAKDPAGVDWATEAAESYAWAKANTRPGDEKKDGLAHHRAYAVAALFRLTGDRAYERQFAADTAAITPTSTLWADDRYGPIVYALGGGKAEPDAATLARVRAALLATADASADAADRRALRWGGNFYMPMLVGQQTTPWVLELAVGHRLSAGDPTASGTARARRYSAALYTTCDYFLGTNALNQTWVTGLGPRHPREVFHMDGWYNGTGRGVHPGVIPYGPWRKERDLGNGPWDQAWPHGTLYPPIDQWPGNERWFENRCAPMGGEFTVHQNTAPAAAIFGLLCAPGPASPAGAGRGAER